MLPMNRLKMSNKKRVSLRTLKSYKNTRYGASVLIGLFEKVSDTQRFLGFQSIKFPYICFTMHILPQVKLSDKER